MRNVKKKRITEQTEITEQTKHYQEKFRYFRLFRYPAFLLTSFLRPSSLGAFNLPDLQRRGDGACVAIDDAGRYGRIPETRLDPAPAPRVERREMKQHEFPRAGRDALRL